MNLDPRISHELKARLQRLYQGDSKHGGYHPVPGYLDDAIPEAKVVQPRWRDPRPRLRLLLHELRHSPEHGDIVEIGANSGYQTLALARQFPTRRITAIEANASHSEFIMTCAALEDLRNIVVLAEAVSPSEVAMRWPGATVLDFNVVHHVGSDFEFGDVHNPDEWWERGLPAWLDAVPAFTEYWFSTGYRLGGTRGRELHDPGDPGGFLDRIVDALPRTEDCDVAVWMADPDGDDIEYVSADIADPRQVNSFIRRAEQNKGYRGEYFRRPILRFRYEQEL